MPQLYLSLNLTRRLVLLLCLFVVGFFLVNVLTLVIGIDTTPKIRIITVMQDLFMFIMPAIVTAVMVTRQPATLMDLDRRPVYRTLVCAICCMIFSIPVMDVVIYLNQQLPLPAGLASAMRALEDSAASTLTLLNGSHDIPNLIMSIMIVGILAGLSEEILFRGGLQRLLVTGGVNVHAAIWITAAVFSMMHLQFYGFVPRMLLGAFFGYTLYWSHSLWVPVILHTLNNTIYLISEYCSDGAERQLSHDTMGIVAIVLSFAVTAFLLHRLWRMRRHIDS